MLAESVMQIADIPLETDVYIINKVSHRKLNAKGGKNWQEGLGAGLPPSAVHADGVWRIVQEVDGFRILNKYSQRSLHAAPEGNWERKRGAGSPISAVHSDGVWHIMEEEDGFRITNKHSQRALYAVEGRNWEREVGASWQPANVHPFGVWYITVAQEQSLAGPAIECPDLTWVHFPMLSASESAELPCLWQACNCYAVWAVPDAEWMVGVHAPRHGGFCWRQLASALPSGEHHFNFGYLEIRGFQCL